MPRRRQQIARLVAALLVSLLVGCAGADSPDAPLPSDPRFGTAGNVLISDRGRSNDLVIDRIWIGFHSQQEFQNFLALNQRFPRGGFWIGGKVVARANLPLGFYFDPNTTGAAEVTIEAIQTTLDQIKADPNEFAKNIPGRWVVSATVERIVPPGQ